MIPGPSDGTATASPSRPSRRPRPRGRRALAGALLLSALLLLDAAGSWLVLEDAPREVDAAVVLAGDPGYERTATAVELLRSGQARLLVLTGGEPGPGDSASSLLAYALRHGVAPDRVRLEATSRSTREALEALRPILEGERVKSIALVTSPYHQRRAYLTARKQLPGLSIVNRPAAPSAWTARGWWRRPSSWWVVPSEYGKLAYYWVRGWL